MDPTFISRVLNVAATNSTLRLTESVAQALRLAAAYFAEYRELYLIERIKADPEIRDWLFGLFEQAAGRIGAETDALATRRAAEPRTDSDQSVLRPPTLRCRREPCLPTRAQQKRGSGRPDPGCCRAGVGRRFPSAFQRGLPAGGLVTGCSSLSCVAGS